MKWHLALRKPKAPQVTRWFFSHSKRKRLIFQAFQSVLVALLSRLPFQLYVYLYIHTYARSDKVLHVFQIGAIGITTAVKYILRAHFIVQVACHIIKCIFLQNRSPCQRTSLYNMDFKIMRIRLLIISNDTMFLILFHKEVN